MNNTPEKDWRDEFDKDFQIAYGQDALLKGCLSPVAWKLVKDFISVVESTAYAKGQREGAKEIIPKIRGLLMMYPEELQDEITVVLENYLSTNN